MSQRRCEFVLPELDLEGVPIAVSLWLAAVGQRLVAGDPLLEVSAGDVTVDLPAPESGLLTEQRVEEDELLVAGQVLGIIVADA